MTVRLLFETPSNTLIRKWHDTGMGPDLLSQDCQWKQEMVKYKHHNYKKYQEGETLLCCMR